MAFAIMRAKKLKGMGSVASSLQHCYRERETLNADLELTPSNHHLAARSTDEAMGKLREQLPEKRRKDAVLAVEYLMTASPEWWDTATKEQQQQFFVRSMDWLTDKYGAENVITASIHRDETSPHLSAFVVPKTADGRLSAKEFIGDRGKMSADQSSYAERVADLGLERGIKRSQAKHQSIQKHYAAIERAGHTAVTITPEAIEPKVIRKGFLTRDVETPGAVAARLTDAVKDVFQPTVAKASESAHNAQRAKDLQSTALEQQKRLERLQEPFKGLSKEQVAEVLRMALKHQKDNERQKEQLKQERLQERKEQGRDRGGFSR